MSERQGVEIDYCPTCRGVWLDRGELDKMIEKGSARAASYRGDDDDDHPREAGGYRGKRREGFLGDLFDF